MSALPPVQALAELMRRYCACELDVSELEAVASGASGRSIMRVPRRAETKGIIGIAWTAARADNASFLPAAKGLAAAGIRVPAVLAEMESPDGCGACLVEDLGAKDLLSLKTAPRAERMQAYRSALQTLVPFHQLKPDWPLQPAFDESLYRWEQEYFAEHLVGRHLGKDAAAFLAHPALQEMAAWLAELPRVPVHRDCQSQNIMLHGGQAWLIDFQGMRMGRAEYDLASLLCDPYVELAADEQDALLRCYEELSGCRIAPAVYSACALQRVMQALGAFANIGYNQQRSWYLRLIPTGLSTLRRVAQRCPADTIPNRVATWLLNVL